MGLLFLKNKNKFEGTLELTNIDLKRVKTIVLNNKFYLLNGVRTENNHNPMIDLIKTGKTADLKIENVEVTYEIHKEKIYYEMYKHHTFYVINIDMPINQFVDSNPNYTIRKFYKYHRDIKSAVLYNKRLNESMPINAYSAFEDRLKEIVKTFKEFIECRVTGLNMHEKILFLLSTASVALKQTKPNEYKKLNLINDIEVELKEMLFILKRDGLIKG